MRLTFSFIFTAFIFALAASSVFGQNTQTRSATQTSNSTPEANAVAASSPQPEKQPIWIYLVGGGRIGVDEVMERAEGVWYTRGNLSTFIDRARVARIEREAETKPKPQVEIDRGVGNWTIADAGKVESFFVTKFGRRLPLTAFGQSVLHTHWGYDHRNSMDVGLHPDSREGRALIEFLRKERIPYQAFRGAVPGAATGPHIHIGRPSPRLPSR